MDDGLAEMLFNVHCARLGPLYAGPPWVALGVLEREAWEQVACLSRKRSAAKDADEIAMRLREANTAWQRQRADLEAQRRDDSSAGTADPFAVEHRVDELLLKLLDGIERDITDGRLPGPHVEAFEALCRAGRARSGR